MRLKNRKGLTAMVDAMIFIVVMGLAVSAMFAFGGDNSSPNDASTVSDNIFSAKLRACDIADTEDARLISVPDVIAFYFLAGDGKVIDYIQSILDSLLKRPNSYRLEISYNNSVVTIGSGTGDPISGSVKEYTVTYGGAIRTDLSFY